MERGKALWKKAASLVLSAAMVVTGLNMSMPVTVSAANEGQEAVEQMPQKLVYFDFENQIQNNEIAGVTEVAGKTVKGIVRADGEKGTISSGTGGKIGTGALVLAGGDKNAHSGKYLQIQDADGKSPIAGKEELTISFWDKTEKNNPQWTFFALKSEKDENGNVIAGNNMNQTVNNKIYYGRGEQYFAILHNDDRKAIKLQHLFYGRNGDRCPAGEVPADYAEGTTGQFGITNRLVDSSVWNFITVTAKKNPDGKSMTTTLYVNGVKRAEGNQTHLLTTVSGDDGIDDDNSILDSQSRLYLGWAGWGGGEYFNGSIDDFVVYDGVLSHEQVIGEYTKNMDKGELMLAANNMMDEWKTYAYSEASFMAVQTAIDKIDTMGPTPTAAEKAQAYADVLKAEENLRPASVEEINHQESLQAWYPLKENANDASGNENNGDVKGNVNFGSGQYASFPGNGKLANYIELPTDTLNLTENMTFSFWVDSLPKGESHTFDNNMFGIGSMPKGEGDAYDGTSAKHLYFSSAKGGTKGLNAFVSNSGWHDDRDNPDDGHKGIGGEASTFKVGEWHHVTGVVAGKLITLYVDGKMINEEDTDITLKEAWDAADSMKYAYIGNCAYGYPNADLDFLGYIKDLRIYNSALLGSQVKEVYDLPMNTAKEELFGKMKASKVGDKNLVDIVTEENTKNIELPASGSQGEEITWASTDPSVIPVPAGVSTTVTVNVADEPKNVTLTATIKLNGVTDTMAFDCTVMKPFQGNTEALETAIAKETTIGDTNPGYTADSWNTYRSALANAKRMLTAAKNQGEIDDAVTELNNAIAALEADKSDLQAAIQLAEGKVESAYTPDSWSAMQTALTSAKTVEANGASTPAQVTAALNELMAKVNALEAKPVTYKATVKYQDEEGVAIKEDKVVDATKAPYTYVVSEDEKEIHNGDKVYKYDALTSTLILTNMVSGDDASQNAIILKYKLQPLVSASTTEWNALDKAIKDGDAADRDDFSEANWTDLQSKLGAAKAVWAKKPEAGSVEVTTATNDLKAALEKAVPKVYTKAEADKLAADAEKLLEGKNEYEYTAKVWKDMQDALAAAKSLTATSTPEQITTAYKNLKKAMAAFEPIVIDKEALATFVSDVEKDLAKLNKADYVPAAWTKVETALAEAKGLPENADDAAVKAAYGNLWTAYKELKGSPYVAVESITFDPASLTLDVGGTATIKATVNPADATDNKPVWSTSAANVATVDQNGKVTAVGSGTADIKATAGGKTATCKVTVRSAEVKVTGIKISADNKNIMAGKKTTVKADVAPANATNKAVTFKSSNTKLATVNNKGVVTTKKAGAGKKVTITATANDGSNVVSNKLTIKIMKYGVKKVSFKKKTMNVKAGQKVTLKPTITLTNKKAKKSQVNKTLSYKSSNTKWATVNSKGKVTTKKAGKGKTVKITAMSTDGTNKKAVVTIKIKK